MFGLILDLSQVNTKGLNFRMMSTVSVSFSANFKTKWMSGFQIVAISTFLLIFSKVVIPSSFGLNGTKFLLNILWGETTNLSIEIVIVRSLVVNPFNVLYGAE